MDSEDRDHFRTIANQSLAQPDGLKKLQSAGNLPSGLDPAYCLSRTKLLFACYRKDEAHDPDLYCAAVAAILAGFSKAAVDYATDPRTGIPSEMKFLPSVAEVRECCVRAEQRMLLHTKPSIKIERQPYQAPKKLAPGESYIDFVQKHGRPVGVFENPDDEWNGRKQRVFIDQCKSEGIT